MSGCVFVRVGVSMRAWVGGGAGRGDGLAGGVGGKKLSMPGMRAVRGDGWMCGSEKGERSFQGEHGGKSFIWAFCCSQINLFWNHR